MNSGICVCVLLAVFSTTCLGRPSAGSEDEGIPATAQLDQGLSGQHRHVRSAPSNGQLKPFIKGDESLEERTNLGELLARLISRKGSFRRNSTMNNKAGSMSANHRIKDRDYLGWMDFGRRSAEEYEYSS
ncbi:cholecystokinin [Amia ocellicauda]|uniref:cholecystokinin n=1 Tax=Amia ocellicauda TaxID=2972642 RepID=UPI003464BA48|nr:CCKN protein [Amia calva]